MVESFYATGAETAEIPVPEVLRPWVSALWTLEARGPVRVRSVPDGCLDVVATLDGLQVSGVLERPEVWEVPAGTRLAGARLRPGAAALLGVPADELPPRWVPLREVRRTDPDLDLVEALARRALLARGDPRTAEALEMLGRANGSLAVSVVARRVGVSERTLGRMFRAAVGLPPRTYARVVRFQAALRMMRGPADLSSVAFQVGYADQAHLTREVSALAGLPPGRLRLAAR